jgi:cell division protein FtsQ
MAVAPYPVVKDLRVTTQFPHGMRIKVIEQIPVAQVSVAGRTVTVASDGTLLHDVPVSGGLPLIPLPAPPGGTKLTDRTALSAVALLALAPDQLLAQIGQVTSDPAHGLVAQLRNGPSIYFGGTGGLAAKWAAAEAVLADQNSAGASYIDVTDPQRPAAGTTGNAGTTSPPSIASATGGG